MTDGDCRSANRRGRSCGLKIEVRPGAGTRSRLRQDHERYVLEQRQCERLQTVTAVHHLCRCPGNVGALRCQMLQVIEKLPKSEYRVHDVTLLSA